MSLPEANIRSTRYLIAETQVRCPQCSRFVRVLALGLPPGHEALVDGEWQTVEANAFIFRVAALPQAVIRLLHGYSAEFHPSRDREPADRHWTNHCPHCAWVFDEDELHCEPCGFMPSSVVEAHAISLTQIESAVCAFAAGYALEPQFFACMRLR
jgi:hypothetical protein